jgi:hypothetical protein
MKKIYTLHKRSSIAFNWLLGEKAATFEGRLGQNVVRCFGFVIAGLAADGMRGGANILERSVYHSLADWLW